MRITIIFALAVAMILAVALVGPASATLPTAISFTDSLETYTPGNLNGQSPWSGTGTSQTVVINSDHYGGTGTQCEKLEENLALPANSHSDVQRSDGIVGYSTPTGAWKLHWQMKFPDRASASGNIWYVYLENAAGADFATFFGGTANAQARWYWGGGPIINIGFADGNWHDFDIVVDQSTQYIYWYVDGSLLKSVKNTITGTSLPDHVRTRLYHRTDVATGQGVLIDDWAYGATDRPSWPILIAPDGGPTVFNFVGGLRPKIDWDDIANQTNYQIKINTTNTVGGTNIWDSGEDTFAVASAVSEGTVGINLSEGTTYYVFVRVKTSTGGWGEWSPPQTNGLTVTASPIIYNPDETCGFNAQGRLFGPGPVYQMESNPLPSGARVKIFTTTSSNPETDTAYWDSGDVSPTGAVTLSNAGAGLVGFNVVHTTPALLSSNLGNPPSNIYYIYAKVRLGDAWGPWVGGRDFVWSSTEVSAPTAPTAVTPNTYVTSTTPPTISWTTASDADQSQIIITDQTTATQIFSSNWASGVSPVNLATFGPPTCPSLINNHVYLVQVRIRKGCLGGADGFPSDYGTSTFTAYSGPPATPIVHAPTDPNQGLKPVVLFHGDPHTQINVKITSDAAGNVVVWQTGEASSTTGAMAVSPSPYAGQIVDGANCNTALTEGALYYAWAKIGNPMGWSAWSASSGFHIRRTAEATDIRHMDEPGLMTARTVAPDDMFFGGMPPGFVGTGCAMSQPACTPGILRITDTGVGGMLRKHNSYIDFDKGTTVVAAVRAWVDPLTAAADSTENWQAGSIIVTDSANHCGASIKVRPNKVAIWTGTDWSTEFGLTPSNDFRIIRITAKAATYNIPSSIEWKVYVDETLAFTKTGAATQAQLETVGSWVTGQVCIGQGSLGLQGIYDYDWLAVNGSGAYAPTQWDEKLAAYNPGGSPRDWKLTGNAYASVSDAIANGETGWATITADNAVINHIATNRFAQSCFYVQDAVPAAKSMKVEGAAPASLGSALTSITGMLSSDGVVKVVRGGPAPGVASPQPSPALPYSALATSIKALGGAPCVTQLAGLGGPYLDNRGMLVRVFGTLPANPSDPMAVVPGYPSGAQIFYVDDLSGTTWVMDGRDSGTAGLRILLDLASENQIWDGSAGIGAGSLVEVVGVSSTDDYISGGVLTTVRRIADPVITQIPKP